MAQGLESGALDLGCKVCDLGFEGVCRASGAYKVSYGQRV